MALIGTECKDVVLYLTEYQRGQLPKDERIEVEEHLNSCNRCKKENEDFENLAIELDKLIPSVSKVYEQDFVYNLFIRTRKENILIKFISILLICSLLYFLFSYDYSKKDYVSIKELKVRSENLFNEDYYSGKKPLNEN
jgi:hypothetical protein